MKNRKRIDEIILFLRLASHIDSQAFYDSENTKNNTNKILADIACDHGLIGLKAYKEGLCDRVIFSDISEKSLEKAIREAKNYSGFANFEFRVGDGLEVLSECVYASILAGIGGREIVKILSKASKTSLSKFFILQTAQDNEFLRSQLPSLGFVILCDKMILENGHIYHTFLAIKKSDEFKLSALVDVDIEVLSYFQKIGLVGISDITQSQIQQYKTFSSPYFGKNNLLINDENHIKMIKWLKSRYNSLLDEVTTKQNELISSGVLVSVSAKEYKRILKERIAVLDKVLSMVI